MALGAASRLSWRQLCVAAGIGIAYQGARILVHRVAFSNQTQNFIHVKGNAEERNIAKPTIATWNVFGFQAGGNYLYGGCTPFRDRFEQIAQTIREQNPDILVLQECFDDKIPEWFIAEFKNEYAHFFIHNGPEKTTLESGLMVLTRCPVKSYDFTPFTDNTPGIRRGFATLTFDAAGKTHAIIGTHLISGAEAIRKKQLEQIHAAAQKLTCEAVILAGDTNINTQNPSEVANASMDDVLDYYSLPPTCTNTFRLNQEPVPHESIDQIALVRTTNKSLNKVLSEPKIIPGYEESSKTARSDHHMLVAQLIPIQSKL